MTTTEVATSVTEMKRTELQAAACRQFGKSAAAWTGRATNEQLRQALATGEVPAPFANGNAPDLAQAIAAAINPLLQAQLDEQRVMELIEARVAELATFVEAKLAERVNTFEVHRPDGSRINVGRTHRQFEELLSWVDAGCSPFLIGPQALSRPLRLRKWRRRWDALSTWTR